MLRFDIIAATGLFAGTEAARAQIAEELRRRGFNGNVTEQKKILDAVEQDKCIGLRVTVDGASATALKRALFGGSPLVAIGTQSVYVNYPVIVTPKFLVEGEEPVVVSERKSATGNGRLSVKKKKERVVEKKEEKKDEEGESKLMIVRKSKKEEPKPAPKVFELPVTVKQEEEEKPVPAPVKAPSPAPAPAPVAEENVGKTVLELKQSVDELKGTSKNIEKEVMKLMEMMNTLVTGFKGMTAKLNDVEKSQNSMKVKVDTTVMQMTAVFSKLDGLSKETAALSEKISDVVDSSEDA